MADKILIRRGNKADLPTLTDGEPGFARDTEEFFVGSPTGNKQVGAGPADTDALPEGATNKYYTEGRVNANSAVAANTAKKESNGIVVIGLVAEAGVDYVFTGTASYAAAVADSRVAKGGTIHFQQGVYVFDTNPSWAPLHHTGSGQWKTALELPAGQTSTGSDTDGRYTFEDMTLTTPGGAFGGGGAGTHTMNWAGNMQTNLVNVVTDYDLRWQPNNQNWPHNIIGCSLGYYGAPAQVDWIDCTIFMTDSWGGGGTFIKWDGNGELTFKGCNSIGVEYTGAANSGSLIYFIGCTSLNLDKGSTGNLTNCRVIGCSDNGSPPVGFAGHFVGNEATDIRGTVV